MAKDFEKMADYLYKLRLRLEKGGDVYEDRSFMKTFAQLLDEKEEEIIDIVGWGFPEWLKVDALRNKCRKLDILEKRVDEWLASTVKRSRKK